ncbi:branched-chain amino acid ABC transporter permease [Streptomyces sp. SHP 1-2]|uniref:branched-chain amino acid ABC transporter permease n=1 Tax=Streptomyces sp. SHP 1-2 TaxID=2769489 RepID=UPI002238F22C|nr:branched-chain amino acid ABC transporter permease [Streptomyces sp. SHP 1-2]
MSEQVVIRSEPAVPDAPASAAVTTRQGTGRRWPLPSGSWWKGVLVAAAVVAVLLAVPYYLGSFWLNLGTFAAATAIGAIGLTVLYGRVGQLSLAHSFFLAVGAYSYIFFAAEPGSGQWGLGLPPFLAVIAAVVLSGVFGLLCSPIAARLKGISLGVATIALVFIGQHVLFSVPALSGGFNGRAVPALTVGGVELLGNEPELVIGGVPFERAERLWLLCALALALTWWFTRRALHSRTGRAFVAIRDGEHQAAALGIDVARVRAMAFLFSAVLAGLAGVLLAVAFRRVVPEYWSLMLALQFLAMIVIGGVGSLGGAVGGALFVTLLPLLLQRYGSQIPGLDTDPGGAFPPSVVAQLAFGVLIVVIMLVEPKGLTEIARRVARSVTGAERVRRLVPPRFLAGPPAPEPGPGPSESPNRSE